MTSRVRTAARTAAAALLAAAVAASTGLDRAGAQAPPDVPAPGAALVELCEATGLGDLPEIGPRTCTSFDAGAVLAGGLCQHTPIPPEVCAQLTDGRVVDPALVDDFVGSWTNRALRLQERLDRSAPLRESLVPHTHNSANSNAYLPTLSTIDPNQRYTIGDQLRMGIRGIELDLHWVPHPTGSAATGSAATGGNAVALCHATQVPLGAVNVHLGCSVDRLIGDGLAEVAAFLAAPGNEDVVLMLYLENQLEDDPVAHDRAAAAIAAHLGDLVARPPTSAPCAEPPWETSRADLLARGHRVLLVGDCGPGAWGSWVHERGDRWDEHQSRDLTFPECVTVRAAEDWEHRWTRIYEDSTWLSAMVGGGSSISPAETRAMVRCGVDMIGFDRLEPDDGRLDALVWSWAPGEPDDGAGACARSGPDRHLHATDCAEAHHAACRVDGDRWMVPPGAVPWVAAGAHCQAAGGALGVPATGWDNERLRAAAATAGVTSLWLDHARVEGEWLVAPVAPPDASGSTGTGAPPSSPPARRLPATGGSAAGSPAVLALAVGLAGLLGFGGLRRAAGGAGGAGAVPAGIRRPSCGPGRPPP